MIRTYYYITFLIPLFNHTAEVHVDDLCGLLKLAVDNVIINAADSRHGLTMTDHGLQCAFWNLGRHHTYESVS